MPLRLVISISILAVWNQHSADDWNEEKWQERLRSDGQCEQLYFH